MRNAVLVGAALVGTLPLLAGCVTRQWVRDLTEKRVIAIESLVTEQGQRIGAIEGQVGEQGERVRTLEKNVAAVAESAQGARARAEEVDNRLTRLWSNRHQRQLVESAEVYFGFDRADLDDAAQTALVGLVRELQANPQLSVELQGYADPRGTVPYNIALSQRRVEAVRRYLVQQGVELPRIHSVGLGPIFDGGVEDAQKRRVTIRLMTDAS